MTATLRRFAPTALVVAGVIMLAAALVMWRLSPGPSVPLWTGSSLCYLSSAQGELVAEPISGVGIIENFGGLASVTRIRWPDGYTARQSGSVVEVLDQRAIVVARTGTRMQIQGGYGDGFEVCNLTHLDGSPEMTLLP